MPENIRDKEYQEEEKNQGSEQKQEKEKEQMTEQEQAKEEIQDIKQDNREQAEETCPEALKYKAQSEEYLQLLQRLQADFDNFRRRTVQEREEAAKYCSLRLAASLLPVLDNFERALAAPGDDLKKFMEGVELIYKQLKGVLEKEGVTAMEAVGKEFDPNFHEAVMHAPSDEYPDNTVIEEFQKGYMLIDRVIRPAMVKVAKS